jgi:hypothetical protein
MSPVVAPEGQNGLGHDPLEDPSYFQDPVRTLVCSIEARDEGHGPVALYDIAEAYNILSLRIRSSAETIGLKKLSFPALGPLKENGSLLVQVMQRDICRALVERPPIPSHAASVEFQSYNENRDAIENCIMAQSILLCHYALRLLAEVFRFSTLYTVFSCESECVHNSYYF